MDASRAAAVALFCSESTGHVNPMLRLSELLAARGYEVHFYAPTAVRPLVEGAGATWQPFGREDLTTYSAAREAIEERLAMEVPKEVNKLPYSAVPAALCVLPYLLGSVARLAPRFVVFDACAPWGSILADVLRLPAVSCMSALPESMADRARTSKDFSLEGQKVLDAAVAAIKASYGVEFDHNHAYSTYAPCSLVCTSREWHKGHAEFSADQFCYWGPLVSERRGVAQSQGGAAVQHLLSDSNLGRDGRPLFLCSLGTVTTGSGFAIFGSAVQDYYRKLCQAAALLPHVTFIFAVGKSADLEEEEGADGVLRVTKLFGEPVPENVTVARSVDQPRLLPRCNGFLTHCGQNSSSEALLAAVPVVAAPFFGDQLLNALRFRELGCGLIESFHVEPRPGAAWEPDLDLVTPGSLAAAMRCVLEEPRFRSAMADLKARQDAELGGPPEERLDDLLARVGAQAKALGVPRLAAWATCGGGAGFAGA